jgi:ACS family tartrate transporter-like MFS transporter
LTLDERNWLTQKLASEKSLRPTDRDDSVLKTLSNPRVLALSLCYFGATLALYGVILWIPQLLSNIGIAAPNIGYAVAMPYTIAALGMVSWCRHSDRTNERTWHLVAASLVAFTGLAASAMLRDSPAWSLVAVTAGATGTLAVIPIFWTVPASFLRGAAAAAAIALINAVGNGGGFVGPFAIGWIKDATGSFSWGLVVAAGGILLSGIIALLIGRDSE